VNEHGFIQAVHRYLPDELLKWKINDGYTGGVPDAFYLGATQSLFVEYKYIKTLPKRDTTLVRPHLTEQQKLWLNRMCNFKQPVAVIIGTEKDQAVILIDKRWNNKITKEWFIKKAVTYKTAAKWIERLCCIQTRQEEPHG
jgi:hypothetical protein